MGFAGAINSSLVAERSVFLTRVYGLFLASVGVAFAGAAAGMSVSWGTASLMGLLSFGLLFAASAARKTPGLNVALLFAFTFAGGMSLGPRINIYHMAGMMSVVWQALEITIGSFLALTLYVYIAKEDFTWLGGFLWPALIGLLITGLLHVFWPMSASAVTAYSYLGVLVFIGFVLFDTSRILTRYPDDAYVSGAIDLYLDFVNMFLFILRILSGKSRD